MKTKKNTHDPTIALSVENSPTKIPFVGPRALFDPNFIPPVFVPDRTHEHELHHILQDAFDHQYSTNLMLLGLKGNGKNLLLNQWVNNFIHSNTIDPDGNGSMLYTTCLMTPIVLNSYNAKLGLPTWRSKSVNGGRKSSIKKPAADSGLIRIDCSHHDTTQILLDMVLQLAGLLGTKIPKLDIIESDSGKLWSVFKFLHQKLGIPLFVFLQKVEESLHGPLLSKLYHYSKNQGLLYILSGMEMGAHRQLLHPIDGLEHIIHLNSFQVSSLLQVLQDRCQMAFQQTLTSDSIQNLADYIVDFDLHVPGSCINLLKRSSPLIQNQGDLTPEQVRDLSQYHFENFSFDAYSMAEFITNTTFEDRVFLDFLVNSFNARDTFYLNFNQIYDAYLMTAEDLGFRPSKAEFLSSLRKITDAQIIRPSHFQPSIKITGIPSNLAVPYYLTIPLEEMTALIRLSFGDVDDESAFDLPNSQKPNKNKEDYHDYDDRFSEKNGSDEDPDFSCLF
jgi:hypothetical protein